MNAIDNYIRLAEAWGVSLENGESSTANSLHDRIQDIFQYLCRTKQENGLFERADTVSGAACFFIASHLKERDPSRATRLYERLTSASLPFVGLSAKQALSEMTTHGN